MTYFHQRKQKTGKSYRRELLKSKLKAFCVVCNSFSCDVLYSILQQLLVPHVGLNQMVETRRLIHPGVKLAERGKELGPTNHSYNYTLWAYVRNYTNAAHNNAHTQTLPPGLGCYQVVVNRHIHQAPLIASHPRSSTIWYPWKQDSAI